MMNKLNIFYLSEIIMFIMNETNFPIHLQLLNKRELWSDTVLTNKSELHRKKSCMLIVTLECHKMLLSSMQQISKVTCLGRLHKDNVCCCFSYFHHGFNNRQVGKFSARYHVRFLLVLKRMWPQLTRLPLLIPEQSQDDQGDTKI